MGIDPVSMMVISFAGQAVSGLMEYQQQKKADKAEKRAYEESIRIANEQAALDKADADRAARAELEDARQHEHLQKMLYLASGVDLTGSPLLVTEETRNKGIENAKNIRESAGSRANLVIQSAVANKPVSRASLTSTLSGIAKSGASMYNDYSMLKKQIY